MNLKSDLERLITLYKNLLQTCVEALDPQATPEQREQVRKSIAEYLGNKEQPKQ